MGVGSSADRTPGKHLLLHKILGMEVGVCSARSGFYLVESGRIHLDLCAGDGRKNFYSGTSSPEIIGKHTKHLFDQNHYVEAIFCEKDRNTAESLKRNLHQKYPESFCCVKQCSAYDAIEYIESIGFTGEPISSAFVYIDPNSAAGIPIDKSFFRALPLRTTFFCTIGANANGVKKGLSLKSRLEWKEKIDEIIGRMPETHRALLVSLRKDTHQWAYLITGPEDLRSRYKKMADDAFKGWPHGLHMVWDDEDPYFRDAWNRLVYTRKEIEKKQEEGQLCINF